MMPPASSFDGSQYRAVFEAAPDAIVLVDAEGRIRDLNPQAERLFGYSRDELLGDLVERLVPESLRERHRNERTRYMEAPRARPMGIGLELTGRRKDGTAVPVEISLSPLSTGTEVFVIAIVRDMTERNRLRRFGTGAVKAAEEERIRIARELHDDTAQRMAALLLQLQVARGIEDPERRDAVLEEVREGLLSAAGSIRRIARGLRPPELEEMGLLTALRSLARRLQEARGLEVVVESDLAETHLAAEAELALYRIVQEALTNAVRHADASRLRISLSSRDQMVVVMVEDDGCGFDPERASDGAGAGLGLIGMRERVGILGGVIQIQSAPDAGTRVQVELPREPKVDPPLPAYPPEEAAR